VGGIITEIGVIGLGDYIDLESLSIAGYPAGTEQGKLTNTANTDLGDGKGTLLRLMVVGINSFQAKGGDDDPFAENGTDPHLVFHFQNLPVYEYVMNQTGTSAGSYAASDGRAYLVPVDGKDGSGVFQRGLTNAGVPFDLDRIWGPTRYVANGGSKATSADKITDKLWLPTEWELFGTRKHSSSYETATNQARLGYYTSDGSRLKYRDDGTVDGWWEASPYSDFTSIFCGVTILGVSSYAHAINALGFAPAFCVK
jgi:hypothetical protein